jgi:AraC-like DNA-binding protein
LFKAATGVPLSRYRLWMAMGSAMRSLLRGDSLTNAALHAGFASSAHFSSSSYREMFGLEPSRLGKLHWSAVSPRE